MSLILRIYWLMGVMGQIQEQLLVLTEAQFVCWGRLGRPLEWWLVCLLHGNELPLRRLIQKLDGERGTPGSIHHSIVSLVKSLIPVKIFQYNM